MKYDISTFVKHGLYGKGGTDMTDEWHHNGSYYSYIQNTFYDVKHNYHAHLDKLFYEAGFKIRLYLCLDANSSDDYLLLETTFKTTKEARWFVAEFVKDYEQSGKFEKKILPELRERYRPVYTRINGKLQVIGQTIFGPMSDTGHLSAWRPQQFRYYHENMPHYHNYRNGVGVFLTVKKDRISDDEYVSYCELGSGSRGCGAYDKENSAAIMKEMSEII